MCVSKRVKKGGDENKRPTCSRNMSDKIRVATSPAPSLSCHSISCLRTASKSFCRACVQSSLRSQSMWPSSSLCGKFETGYEGEVHKDKWKKTRGKGYLIGRREH